MTSMRAAVCREFGKPLTIETVTLAPPTGRAIEVTLEACAICHSDISYADGAWGGTLPAVYGHEAAGRITALGEGVTGFAMGERVIVTLMRACGGCAPCTTGHPATCTAPVGPDPLTLADGAPCHQAMATGAFAEKVVVDQSQIARIPKGLSADVASLLSCGVITGIGAVVNSGGLRPGEDAVVIGAGGVGLNAIQGARLAGARRIVAVDMVPGKLEDARAFGATDTILATRPAPWDDLFQMIGKGADAVFVTVGAAPVYTSAPNYLARGGRLVMVGMPASGAMSEYDAGTMAAYGQRLIGSKMGDTVLARDIPWLADLYLQGRLKLDELISGRWPLEEINEAIADTKSGKSRRNVIVF
ncbi:alcohol dehydrogenase catalytic domain-containing protein [Alphaproteobacteria bacterium GH1-50]|uniref:Alcohol dehydrogenase catalytic domain-containing protein n=1 Tax=Kangsaoukella pontilimi TaxID=2691042 RepID=A0A7C9J559_9RHOB|nr:Zn-dependent alcohol dehydrogenase [Kangsaoukella pontilimi]MXQ09141.1 alcohol dehydrogenase catalytic domain-containing protein [Kangsaoukella pontilimi]